MTKPTPYPWISGAITITKAALDVAYAEAKRAYPSECCGFLSGPVDRPLHVDVATPTPNEADKYHALDPERFPRTSTTYFKINELKAQRAFDEGEKTGRPIKVIYHSHCDAGAYFSAEDSATFAHGGELQWPCAFLVVSVVSGEIREHCLWVHKPGTGEFVQSTITVVDDGGKAA